jgi:hypothetical protein
VKLRRTLVQKLREIITVFDLEPRVRPRVRAIFHAKAPGPVYAEPMYDVDTSDTDPHDAIESLEAQIEEINSRLASCRKFILVGRIAVLGSAILLAAILFGAIEFDARLLLAAIAALLGGFIIWGSNRSTAEEAAAELAKTEAERVALIGRLDLHVVTERPTLH